MEITTAQKFRKAAERLLRNANPNASLGLTWQFARRVTWADGTTGYSGITTVQAPGFRTRDMIATYSHGELSVR